MDWERKLRCAVWCSMLLLVLVGSGLAQQPSKDCPTSTTDERAVPAEERAALVALYESTDGPHWTKNAGWLWPAGTECDWYGVVCGTGRSGPVVVALNLYQNNLNGTVPDAIGVLTQLLYLELSSNKLRGRLPESLGKLTQLDSLDLRGNSFQGLLPEPLLQKAREGPLSINAESSLLTDVTAIDFESDFPSLLCGSERIVMNVNDEVVKYSTKCRNANRDDRLTFCEVKRGHMHWFAELSWLIEKSGFYKMNHDYDRSITHGEFDSLRVVRDGHTYEVINYAHGGPLELWGVQLEIQGVISSIEWEHTTKQAKCPRW